MIYDYLLKRFAPELRNIIVDNSGYPVPYFGYRYLRYLPQIWERALLKLPRSFRRFSLRKPTITHRILAQKNLAALSEILLEHSVKSDLFFIPGKLEEALSDFVNGRKDNYAVLFQAANLKQLLELFA